MQRQRIADFEARVFPGSYALKRYPAFERAFSFIRSVNYGFRVDTRFKKVL
ncbi:hypothetical protein D3C81_1669300 [compost metagenome]